MTFFFTYCPQACSGVFVAPPVSMGRGQGGDGEGKHCFSMFFHKQRLALTYHLFVGWGGRWVCWTLLGSNHTFDFGVDLDLDLDPAKLD